MDAGGIHGYENPDIIGKEDKMEAEAGKRKFKKSLGALDTLLFTICAMLFIDTIAPTAAIGPSSLSWWVILIVAYYIPYGLITAELGSTYPEQGGLYAWVKRAFGNKWAARTTWLYWINIALWVPSSFIFFAGMFSQLFFPGMGLWPIILVSLVMIWLTVYLGSVNLDLSKWVVNLASVLKLVIVLGIGIAAFIFIGKNDGPVNDLSFSNILPRWDDGLFYLSVILYNLLGFELMSGAGEEMKDPKKDVPKSILLGSLVIGAIYILGTWGILAVVPSDQIGLIEGLVDTFRTVFGTTGFGAVLAVLFGVFAMYTIFSQTVTWTIGGCKAAAEAGVDGELPAFFGKMKQSNQAPIGTLIITGTIASVVMLLYGFMASNAEDLFWTLFAFSSMVFIMPYVIMFPAFLKLRRDDGDRERPYRVPGGKFGPIIMAIVCEFVVVMGIILFIWVPGEPIDWAFAVPVLIGIAATLGLGEFLITAQARKKD